MMKPFMKPNAAFELDLEGSFGITDMDAAFYRTNNREWKMFVRKKFQTVSAAIDEKYRLIRERSELKEDVGWVAWRRAMQGVE